MTVGIDLGTTNSAIAIIGPDGQPEVLPNAEGRKITPSVVQLRGDGSVLVGEQAKHEMALEKENTAHFFKRDMGTGAVFDYHGRSYTPVDLSAEVLKKLKVDGEAALGKPIRQAVITVPAYFHDGPRIATRQAAEQAGLEVLQIINEPTAAALAYGLRQTGPAETVLVYDLGGGTFDISLVTVTPEAIEVIGTDGNHELGGKDWDDRIVQYLAEEFRRRHGLDPLDEPYSFQELLVRAEEAKKALTERARVAVPVSCQGRSERLELTRERFEEDTQDLLSRTELLMEAVLQRAGFDYARLGGVLFVGGSTRMPMCANLVQRLTGRPPRRNVNPDECVAMGAAIQASLLQSTPARGLRRRVQDVTSHSLGMLAVSPDGKRYLNSILIPRNRPIPSRDLRPYQVKVRAGAEAAVAVYVTQGEGEDPAQCSYVGKYRVTGVAPNSKGKAVLDIAYAYDPSGVVEVSATQRGHKGALEVLKEPIPDDMSWVSRPPRAPVQPRSVYLAVDLSGSMYGRPIQDAQEAMRGFVRQSDLAHTSIGLIAFADSVQTAAELSQDADRILRGVASLPGCPVGGGNSAHPFSEALQLLGSRQGERLLVVLTDGCWCYQDRAIEAARRCHQENIQVVALGFGSADEAFLRAIASADQAAMLSGSGELVAAFEQIAQVLVEDRGGSITAGLRRR